MPELSTYGSRDHHATVRKLHVAISSLDNAAEASAATEQQYAASEIVLRILSLLP